MGKIFSIKNSIKIVLFSFLMGMSNLHAQDPTIGNIFFTEAAANNLSLISVLASKTTYLVDNCGYIYNSWDSQYQGGLAVVLDEEGHLYRAGKIINSTFANGGGASGVIEKYDWDGTLINQLFISNDSMIFHHDFKVMENGNILALAWKKVSEERAIALGRSEDLINERGFWGEVILELKPTSFDDFEIVWQWSTFDHFVQEENDTYPNFGSPSDFPNKFDINLGTYINLPVDYLHLNSIDYNESLDQILVSSRNLSEIYIIDKSTTTAEAQTDIGGNANKGGGILFRWGNPRNYTGNPDHDNSLFNQHDAQWNKFSDSIKVSFFNNGNNRPEGLFSSVEEINIENTGYNYDYLGFESTQKDDINFKYVAQDSFSFYSKFMSGAQRLSNGNFQITETTKGRIFEIDPSKKIVKEYIVPYNANGVFTQFDDPVSNTLFKAPSYEKTFFDQSLNLENSEIKIELDPIDNCDIVDAIWEEDEIQFVKFQNGAEYISLSFDEESDYEISLYNMGGVLLNQRNIGSRSFSILKSEIGVHGLFVIRVWDKKRKLIQLQKMIIH